MSELNHFEGLWVEKYRPKVFKDIVLSDEDRVFFDSLKDKQEIPHLLFAGTAGVGKTATSKAIITDLLGSPDYLYINASDENSIDIVRSKLTGFAKTKSFDGKRKVILLDEFDGLSGEAMKALRNVMEEFASNTRFILTCNYLFKVIEPIRSRCQIINLIPPIDGVLKRVVEILKAEKVTIQPEQKPLLLEHIRKCLPDLRRIINDIQKFSSTGNLNIRNEVSSDFVKKIFKDLQNKKEVTLVRKEIIENEKHFSNDYRFFLKEMFETVYNSDMNYERKADCLLIISESMKNDAIVVDKEINCFTCLISLSRNMNV